MFPCAAFSTPPVSVILSHIIRHAFFPPTHTHTLRIHVCDSARALLLYLSRCCSRQWFQNRPISVMLVSGWHMRMFPIKIIVGFSVRLNYFLSWQRRLYCKWALWNLIPHWIQRCCITVRRVSPDESIPQYGAHCQTTELWWRSSIKGRNKWLTFTSDTLRQFERSSSYEVLALHEVPPKLKWFIRRAQSKSVIFYWSTVDLCSFVCLVSNVGLIR